MVRTLSVYNDNTVDFVWRVQYVVELVGFERVATRDAKSVTIRPQALQMSVSEHYNSGSASDHTLHTATKVQINLFYSLLTPFPFLYLLSRMPTKRGRPLSGESKCEAVNRRRQQVRERV